MTAGIDYKELHLMFFEEAQAEGWDYETCLKYADEKAQDAVERHGDALLEAWKDRPYD